MRRISKTKIKTKFKAPSLMFITTWSSLDFFEGVSLILWLLNPSRLLRMCKFIIVKDGQTLPTSDCEKNRIGAIFSSI